MPPVPRRSPLATMLIEYASTGDVETLRRALAASMNKAGSKATNSRVMTALADAFQRLVGAGEIPGNRAHSLWQQLARQFPTSTQFKTRTMARTKRGELAVAVQERTPKLGRQEKRVKAIQDELESLHAARVVNPESEDIVERIKELSAKLQEERALLKTLTSKSRVALPILSGSEADQFRLAALSKAKGASPEAKTLLEQVIAAPTADRERLMAAAGDDVLNEISNLYVKLKSRIDAGIREAGLLKGAAKSYNEIAKTANTSQRRDQRAMDALVEGANPFAWDSTINYETIGQSEPLGGETYIIGAGGGGAKGLYDRRASTLPKRGSSIITGEPREVERFPGQTEITKNIPMHGDDGTHIGLRPVDRQRMPTTASAAGVTSQFAETRFTPEKFAQLRAEIQARAGGRTAAGSMRPEQGRGAGGNAAARAESELAILDEAEKVAATNDGYLPVEIAEMIDPGHIGVSAKTSMTRTMGLRPETDKAVGKFYEAAEHYGYNQPAPTPAEIQSLQQQRADSLAEYGSAVEPVIGTIPDRFGGASADLRRLSAGQRKVDPMGRPSEGEVVRAAIRRLGQGDSGVGRRIMMELNPQERTALLREVMADMEAEGKSNFSRYMNRRPDPEIPSGTAERGLPEVRRFEDPEPVFDEPDARRPNPKFARQTELDLGDVGGPILEDSPSPSARQDERFGAVPGQTSLNLFEEHPNRMVSPWTRDPALTPEQAELMEMKEPLVDWRRRLDAHMIGGPAEIRQEVARMPPKAEAPGDLIGGKEYPIEQIMARRASFVPPGPRDKQEVRSRRAVARPPQKPGTTTREAPKRHRALGIDTPDGQKQFRAAWETVLTHEDFKGRVPTRKIRAMRTAAVKAWTDAVEQGADNRTAQKAVWKAMSDAAGLTERKLAMDTVLGTTKRG